MAQLRVEEHGRNRGKAAQEPSPHIWPVSWKAEREDKSYLTLHKHVTDSWDMEAANRAESALCKEPMQLSQPSRCLLCT